MPVPIRDITCTTRTLSEPCDRTKAEKASAAANSGRKNKRVFISHTSKSSYRFSARAAMSLR